MIAVSQNVGGCVRLIKVAKLYMCSQNITHTEVMCLLWLCDQRLCPLYTSTTEEKNSYKSVNLYLNKDTCHSNEFPHTVYEQ